MEAKAMEESSYYLVPRGLLSLLSHTTKNHVPRVGTAPNGLASITSIINHQSRKCPTGLPVGQSYGGIFLR